MNIKTKTILTTLVISSLASSLVYATCAGQTKAAGTSGDSCTGDGKTHTDGEVCTYTAPSPSYDVCDTQNTTETGKICSTGPNKESGIKTVTYDGTCLGGTCNNGTAENDGKLMDPQPGKANLNGCPG